MPTGLLDFFKALADESRLKIVGVLAQRSASVGELADLLDLKEPTVSHHLRKLREVGLVSVQQDGTTRRYRLETSSLEEMSKNLLSTDAIEQSAPVDLEDYDRKVLAAFVEGETLKAIPAQRKKRDVILRWLLDRFEPGERIPETEVNERIQRSHWDSAWLRREMVDAGMLERERGVYWRPASEDASEA
jgi:DNA-binding transcriptional ArsR family regulator